MRKPFIIAHRGDSSGALENSLEAIRRALDVPVDLIEVDIRKSRDDVLYLMHDAETGRTADRDIHIEQSTAADVEHIRLKNGEPVPTLQDVLRLVAGRAGINVELKSDGSGIVFSRQFFEYRYAGYMVVSSFKEEEVAAARGVMLDLPVGCIYRRFSVDDIPGYHERGYRIVSLKKDTVSRELINACHARGIAVYTWTVDEETDMERFISWGVDGIYSNRPAVLKRVRDG